MTAGFVPGSGTSNRPHDYSFGDENLLPGSYAYRIKQVDRNGSSTYSATVIVQVGTVPREIRLGQNFPNPFNPSTTIEFTLPADGRATLTVFDVLGREVATLLDEERQAGTVQTVTVDLARLASGTYYYRLESGREVLTRKMLLMK